MKRLKILLLSMLLLVPAAQAQQLQLRLDSTAYAAVLTCGPGNDFYTTFGHSAIRICDSASGLDVVYNYGTFDFNTSNFYWKFACGNLKYCLSRTSFSHFMEEYIYEGRAVCQQRLRLSNQELNNLFVALETNYLPQFRFYTYDFLRDNCATRVRDMVNNSLAHRQLFVPCEVADAKSYRDLLRDATGRNLMWWQVGIDMLLGMRCDTKCNNLQYMFSPIEMMRQLDSTHVVGTNECLAEPVEQLLEESRPPLSPSVSPLWVFWALLAAVVALTILARVYRFGITWFDVILFSVVFLASALMLFLWLASSHYCTKINFNVLWASPLFLYFAIRPNRSPKWLIVAQIVLLFIAILMTIIAWPQQLPTVVIPISLILIVRLADKLINRNI